jgi:phosphate:Na+ symporter
MKENIQIVFGLLGGLAVFIYGMNMMSECLQKAAGEKMKKILSLLTRNPVMGALAGMLVTAVLQSSSATTVMAIGFVSAGLMTLPQAISIIFGANIGTTMTAQLIAFKLSDYIYAIIFIGFIVYFISKSERVKNIGMTIFAFGLLFLGIETMGTVMKPLASSPVFTELIGKVADIPILGVAVGALMTLVVQSSSATIAVLQNFAAQPGADGVTSIIGLAGAIPILFGDNIGTTITALLASIGQPKDAKRTALAHCIFNISGCFLFIWFVKPLAAFIQYISPKGPEIEVISRQIANTHTFFNLVMTLIWVPLVGVMVKIVMCLIPDGEVKEVNAVQPKFLDNKLISQPTVALQLAVRELMNCGEQVGVTLKKAAEKIDSGDGASVEEFVKSREVTAELTGKITDYFAEMAAAGVMTEQQAARAAELQYVLIDIDRISELTKNVAVSMQTEKLVKKDKKSAKEERVQFSQEASKDIQKSMELVSEMYNMVMKMVNNEEANEAENLVKMKEKIRKMDGDIRKGHIKRVHKGKCKAGLTAAFNEILHNVERIGNSCVNLADAAEDGVRFSTFLREME